MSNGRQNPNPYTPVRLEPGRWFEPSEQPLLPVAGLVPATHLFAAHPDDRQKVWIAGQAHCCPVQDFAATEAGRWNTLEHFQSVMAGLDPAIYAFATHRIGAADGVDHRVKPGDDDFEER